jgi:hypothetical protein
MTIAGLFFIFLALVMAGLFAAREASARRDWYIPIVLCVVHIGFCLAYWYVSLSNGADSLMYWQLARTTNPPADFGTNSIIILVQWIQRIFGVFGDISYLDAFLAFQLFGQLALSLLNETLGTVLGSQYSRFRYWSWLCVLLPGMSFWSCAIGKDGLMMLSVCLTLFASLALRARLAYMAAGFIIAVIIRPHIAAAILISAVLSVITQSKERLVWRVGLMLILVVAVLAFIPIFEQYLQLDTLDFSVVSQSLDARSQFNMNAASSVNISSYPLPLKLFTFLFRPLFFDMSGVLGLAASLENFCLLSMIGYCLTKGRNVSRLLANDDRRYAIFIFAISTLVLSVATSNLGLAERQKTMVLPALFLSLTFLLRDNAAVRKTIRKRIPVRLPGQNISPVTAAGQKS